ncbi:MAG: UDP-3-O-(3-hydroxymyristoyl)glucosamine N-acyltransferase [Planctomycetes bacterium]|nr:UDP-3-O-(3-hydroxymyristoyl)glucosamine N-acyltransferase [Planctomycetota bacterium]
MPEFTAGELAQLVGGRLVGEEGTVVSDVGSLEKAGPRALSFLRGEEKASLARDCRAGVLLSSIEVDGYSGTTILCDDPEAAMAKALHQFAGERLYPPEGISEKASVSPGAELGAGVAVGDYAFIGDGTLVGEGAVLYPQVYVGAGCRIGPRTVLYPKASLHEGASVGADCIIHYHAVIGSEGFGFAQREGKHVKLPQVGSVRIGARVEVGACTTIDRATLDETIIEDGTKIDSHCHIAHNCHVGANCIVAGFSTLGGSVRLGGGVIVAGNVAIKDHVSVGDGAILAAGSGVHNNVPSGAVMFGYPARPLQEQRRIYAVTGRLPDMRKRLAKLEKKVAELSARGHQSHEET